MGIGTVVIALATLLKSLLLLIYYLNNNAFPQPLSEEEEALYLERFKKGDMNARNILIERNLRLVAHIARSFENTGEDREDIISIGTIGLIKAVNTFDETKGTKLATYATKCIKNEILMHLRKRNKAEIFLYDPISTDKEGNEVALIDILGTNPDAVHETVQNNVDMEKIVSQIKYLSSIEKKVVEMRYGLLDGVRKPQREIAKLLKFSRSYVSRIEKRALEKLIKELS
jgi:RNA polymerase sporulation-specific sigma factor